MGLGFAILKLHLAVETSYLSSHFNLYHLSPLYIPVSYYTLVTSTIRCCVYVRDGQWPNGMCSSGRCCAGNTTFSEGRRDGAI